MVGEDALLWIGLGLLAAGSLPLVPLLRRRDEGEGGGLVVALHAGSFLAQTGFMITLIALISLIV